MDYQKLRDDYSDYLILFKTGCFYALWDNDALILNYIYQLKLVNMYDRWKVVFPINSQEFYFNEFEARGLSFIVLERDIIVEKFTAKENNYFKYLKFLMEFKNNTQKIQPDIRLDPYDSDIVPQEEDLTVPNVAYGKNSDAYIPPEETLQGYNQKLYQENLLEDVSLEQFVPEEKKEEKAKSTEKSKNEEKLGQEESAKNIEIVETEREEKPVEQEDATTKLPPKGEEPASQESLTAEKEDKVVAQEIVKIRRVRLAPLKAQRIKDSEADAARKEAEAEAAAVKKQLEIDKRKLDTVKDLYAKLISLDYMTSLVSEELKRLLKELTDSFPEFLEK